MHLYTVYACFFDFKIRSIIIPILLCWVEVCKVHPSKKATETLPPVDMPTKAAYSCSLLIADVSIAAILQSV